MQQTSYKVKQIFAEHWEPFKRKYPHLVTPYIDEVITKSLQCRTEALGCHILPCPDCDTLRVIPNSCKTKFCSPCGAAYNDLWLNKIEAMVWPTPHHHLTVTVPKSLQPLIKANLTLIEGFIVSVKQSLAIYAKNHKVVIPAFALLQTYGSRLNYNAHLHVGVPDTVVTSDLKRLKEDFFYDIHVISKTFVALFARKIRAASKKGQLIMPPELPFRNFSELNDYLTKLVEWCFQSGDPKSWCVHISKRSTNQPLPISYMARYVRTPPISEARIDFWTRKKVVFWVKDYSLKAEDFDPIPVAPRCTIRLPKERRKKRKIRYELPIDDFIAAVIQHIHPKNFRVVRFFGPYSNRKRNKFWAENGHLFPQRTDSSEKLPTTWRERRKKETGTDPMQCPTCKKELKIYEHLYPGDILLKRYTIKQLNKMKFSEYKKLRQEILNEFFDTS